MNAKKYADNPLQANIEGHELVIRIGINRLDGHDRHPTLPKLTFENKTQWAKDVIYELLREEDGSTPLSDLFDKAMNEALEQGSMGVSENSATHIGTCERCGKEFAALAHTFEGQVCAKNAYCLKKHIKRK